MSRLELDLADGRISFRPDEEIEGEIRWDLEGMGGKPPETLELRLFWYTEGKGDQDVSIVDSLSVEAPGVRGDRRFRLSLPAGPLSFTGRLMSLRWALELVSPTGGDSCRADILVAVAEVELRTPPGTGPPAG